MSGDNKGVRRRWWWRWLRGSLIVIGVLFLLLAGTRLFLLYRVRSAISAIRDRGVPTTSAELAAMYGPAAGQGAEDSFAEAFKALRESEAISRLFDGGRLREWGDLLSVKTKREFATYLAKNEEAMALVEKALAKGNCRVPVDLGPAAFSPYQIRPRELREASVLFHMRALLAVEERQPDIAVQAILTQFALARSLGDEAQVYHWGARSSIVEKAVRNIEAALSARILDDRHFSALDHVIREEEAHDVLRRVIQGERCLGIDLIQRNGGFGPFVPFISTSQSVSEWWRGFVESLRIVCGYGMDLVMMRGWRGLGYSISDVRESTLLPFCDFAGFLQADYLHYLRLMEEMESIVQQPYPERVIAVRKLMDGSPSAGTVPLCFHRFCWHRPACSSFVDQSAGVLTLLRCARVAMAAERYRVAKGRWSDQVTELTPLFLSEVPQSPFTGQPLIYRQWGGNCRVYSPGGCMKNLGGHDAGRTFDRFSHDIVFSLYAPADPIPVARCVVRSRKVILRNARGLLTGGGEMALSPTGRHLLILKQAGSGPDSWSYLRQPVVLDIASNQQSDLPMKPKDFERGVASAWMDNIFSAKGNYIHAFEDRVKDTDGRIVLYDVNTKTARQLNVPNASCVISNMDETQLWIDESLAEDASGPSKGQGSKRFRLRMVPLGEGKEEQITLPGFVPANCAKDCVTVISERGGSAECILMDLMRGATIATLPVDPGRNNWPAPFWAPGGRFLCHGGCSRFWDRSRDRVFRATEKTAVAPGPSPHTVLMAEVAYSHQWKDVRLVNLVNGQEWEPIAAEDGDCVCALGKYIVCAKAEKDGSTTLTLIEIGLE